MTEPTKSPHGRSGMVKLRAPAIGPGAAGSATSPWSLGPPGEGGAGPQREAELLDCFAETMLMLAVIGSIIVVIVDAIG